LETKIIAQKEFGGNLYFTHPSMLASNYI